jgi:hypothetical protein
MSDTNFQALRKQLQQSREALQSSHEALFLAHEKLKRIEAQQAHLRRYFDAQNESQRAREKQLSAQHNQTTQAIATLQQAVGALEEGLIGRSDAFLPLTDPRDTIKELSDVYPILLLPLRLETRFKQVSTPDGTAHQLWVRVFPDDCAVDTFEASLSETEVKNAQTYWAQVWRAGDDDNRRRAAWRNLVASHGTGRALWIERNYRPTNAADQPAPNATTRLLVIPSDSPLDDPTQTHVNTYWSAVWKAGDNAIAINTAYEALITAVGAEIAETILKDYRPINMDDPPPVGRTRTTTIVLVAVVKFPSADDTDTKRRAWSKAPHVDVMPERLVLMGYNGDTMTLHEIGASIPVTLITGPDPLAQEGDQIRQEGADIKVSEDMRWMVDFEAALKKGMAFRVTLSPEQSKLGFDRLMVLGVRLGTDERAGQRLLEGLFTNHHYSRAGLSLPKQGTPTNNTDDEAAGYTATDNADISYDILNGKRDALDDAADWFERRDGIWLTQLLGLDSTIVSTVPGATNTDVGDAQAMNIALFPATLGYMIDTMLSPVFSAGAIDFVRSFYTHLVSGRGLAPALRIGRQPYGILPTTVYSRMRFGRQTNGDFVEGIGLNQRIAVGSPFLSKLHEVLMRAYGVWGTLLNRVAHVGDAGDPHKTLLEILGLHPNSAEFDQRYAESLQQVLNTLNLSGFVEEFIVILALLEQGLDILRDHGYDLQELGRPDLLDKFFFAKPFPVNEKKLIDDQPLSEQKPIRDYTTDGRNYIEWLIDAANTSLEAVRLQTGLPSTDRPTALLYIMLKHALMLGYYDTSIRLYERADLLSADALLAARREAPFIHVKQQTQSSESRFKLLYDTQPAITEGQVGVKIADYITSRLTILDDAARLREQISALEKLKARPTAVLERAFVEHIDTCSYRLDAWLQGLAHYQLSVMRYSGVEGAARKGVYVGAYGWVENLRPDDSKLSPVPPIDEELSAVFQRENEPPLMRDSNNAGYVHAPSLNHAVTAAVLRNAYVSTAAPDAAEVFAVNLSSDRVRRAIAIIEGLRNGQSLAALLGYQFERGLHDRHSLAEVDQYIYVLRDRFPLVANRLEDTKTTDHDSITAIEARNVVDGEALVNQIENATPGAYPYGISGLPAAGTPAGDVIAAEMKRLVDTNDAVADVGLAEGIHQVVQGNYDRAAATLESLSSDNLPTMPDVVTTPRSGLGLTLRVGLHLKPGLTPTSSPISGLAMTPRASAEPALNDWLNRILPPPDQVGTAVLVTTGAGIQSTRVITQAQLGLQPIDLLYMLIPADEQAMTALDDTIFRHVTSSLALDATVKILYTQSIAPQFSFFELGALVNQLRPLLLETRPLRSTDIAMPIETSKAQAGLPTYHTNRLTHLITSLNAPASALNRLRSLETELTPLLDDTEANLNNIVTNIDTRTTNYIDALAELNLYGLPQTGFGTAMEWRQARYIALLNKVRQLVQRWQTKLDTFDALLLDYGTLDPQTGDETRFAQLKAIEKQVAIVLTALQPDDTPADYVAVLPARRLALVTKRTQFTGILNAPPASLAALLSSVEIASVGVEAFDIVRLELNDDQAEMVRFTQDMYSHLQKLIVDIEGRVQTAADGLTAYAGATTETARTNAFTHSAHTLLSPEFMVIPEFTLAGEQADEIHNAYNAGSTLLQHQIATLGNDFPVDEWLYGIARVRDMMHRWEALTMLTDAIQNVSLDLHPLQLPYMEDDSWLALSYPKEYVIDKDKLLYTAHYTEPFNKHAPQCGLLLDEWTEVIPTTEETTGVTFHYDRPNAEPPQVMLLVVPPVINGQWEWADLVDTLHETLELAKRRAIEPDHIAGTDYARFLPATIAAVTMHPITIAMNYAIVNNVYATISSEVNNG